MQVNECFHFIYRINVTPIYKYQIEIEKIISRGLNAIITLSERIYFHIMHGIL